MIIESNLAQTSQFADSLDVKVAPSLEKTEDEQARDVKVPEQATGDTVTISEEARALAAAEKSGEAESKTDAKTDSESDSMTDAERQIAQLKKQIEKLEDEIKEIEDDPELTEKQKTQKVQAKQVQLMEMREQLSKAQEEQAKAIGASPYGGTRAEGAGNSAASF